jgi:hypothetical protein
MKIKKLEDRTNHAPTNDQGKRACTVRTASNYLTDDKRLSVVALGVATCGLGPIRDVEQEHTLASVVRPRKVGRWACDAVSYDEKSTTISTRSQLIAHEQEKKPGARDKRIVLHSVMVECSVGPGR